MFTLRTFASGIVLATLAVPVVMSLPPPWETEKMKFERADLIVIAKILAVNAPAKAGGESRADLAISQVLKHTGKAGEVHCQILFVAPAPPGGGPQVMKIGMPSEPKIAAGETALMFLTKVPDQPGKYHVVLGVLGYIRLDAGAGVRQQLQQFQESAGKVEDAALRKQLEDVYRQALEQVEGMKSAL